MFHISHACNQNCEGVIGKMNYETINGLTTSCPKIDTPGTELAVPVLTLKTNALN